MLQKDFRFRQIALFIFVSLVLPITLNASSFRAIYVLNSKVSGEDQQAGIILDAAGNLYGTTLGGGPTGLGTVFKLTKQPNGTWAENTIYSFKGGADGRNAASGVIFDKHGNLYGVTTAGGEPCAGHSEGCGTVYKLSPQPDGSWAHTVLYSFTDEKTVNQQKSGLVFDSAGNLYGAYESGNDECCGVIYRLKPNSDGSWSEDTLYTLNPDTDGTLPFDTLTVDKAGNLYGEASLHGAHECGTVFELSPDLGGNWSSTVLHSFCTSNSDGNTPRGGLTMDAAGNLYGVTVWGGGSTGIAEKCSLYGCGTVFRLVRQIDGSWSYKKIHTFTGTPGHDPHGGVVINAAGTIYGTTSSGGPQSFGSIFQLKPNPDGSWTGKNLHVFKGYPSVYPISTMALDKSGTLYGSTVFAYPSLEGAGTVFKLIP